ncbi:MAG TPA: hypothetical protein ENJ19_04360 [Gammaproteobacteria bacterium]|nr:hypothetical protein [Gammaproteobacteria bacterium]
MASVEQQAVALRSGEASGDGVLETRVFTQQDRMRRAAQVWGLSWLLAVVTVFIPIAHFVLVPGFLIAGPAWAYMRYRVERINEKVSGTCPAHSGEITVNMEGADVLPFNTYCPECQAPLVIEEHSGTPAGADEPAAQGSAAAE